MTDTETTAVARAAELLRTHVEQTNTVVAELVELAAATGDDKAMVEMIASLLHCHGEQVTGWTADLTEVPA
jgi:hypothetical protein